MDVRIKQNPVIFLPGILLFGYIVFRAIALPITHDESNTVLTYAAYPVRDILLYSDPVPNNHILNTLLIKALVSLFDLHSFVVRLPNVLGFLLYYGALLGIIRKMQLPALAACACIFVMTCNPFFIEFFSLARGYALACAFGMLSAYYALCFLSGFGRVDFVKSLLWAAVAVYTSFTFLNYFVALAAVLMLVIIACRKGTPVLRVGKYLPYCLLISFLLGGMIAIPVKRMVETDQFVYWGNKNFYDDTMLTLARSSLYGDNFLGMGYHGWCVVFAAVFCIAAVIAFKKLPVQKYRGIANPSVFFLVLAAGTVCVNIGQFYIVGTPFLTSRTALLFIPILTLPLIFTAAGLPPHWRFRQLPLLIGAGLQLGIFLKNMNAINIYEWWFDVNTFQVLHQLEQYHMATGAEVSLNTNWLYYPSFNFHISERHLEWLHLTPFHKSTDLESTADFYYITDSEAATLQTNYRLYCAYGWDDSRRLLIHR